jgi:hypothetical protein
MSLAMLGARAYSGPMMFPVATFATRSFRALARPSYPLLSITDRFAPTRTTRCFAQAIHGEGGSVGGTKVPSKQKPRRLKDRLKFRKDMKEISETAAAFSDELSPLENTKEFEEIMKRMMNIVETPDRGEISSTENLSGRAQRKRQRLTSKLKKTNDRHKQITNDMEAEEEENWDENPVEGADKLLNSKCVLRFC